MDTVAAFTKRTYYCTRKARDTRTAYRIAEREREREIRRGKAGRLTKLWLGWLPYTWGGGRGIDRKERVEKKEEE